jgi:hypothetical protein
MFEGGMFGQQSSKRSVVPDKAVEWGKGNSGRVGSPAVKQTEFANPLRTEQDNRAVGDVDAHITFDDQVEQLGGLALKNQPFVGRPVLELGNAQEEIEVVIGKAGEMRLDQVLLLQMPAQSVNGPAVVPGLPQEHQGMRGGT